MSDTSNQSSLERARARLEAALSTLTQGVASSRDALDLAAVAAHEKAVLVDRITQLEQENLKLHEQVAAFALQPEPAADDARLTELEEEKAAITNNYQMLKEKYAALQDALENHGNAKQNSEAGDDTAATENSRLKRMVAEMEEEKNAIKGELDKTINELENMLEDA